MSEPLTEREIDILRMAIKDKLDTLISDTKEIKLHTNSLGARVGRLEQWKVKMIFGVWLTSATASIIVSGLALMLKFNVLKFNI